LLGWTAKGGLRKFRDYISLPICPAGTPLITTFTGYSQSQPTILATDQDIHVDLGTAHPVVF